MSFPYLSCCAPSMGPFQGLQQGLTAYQILQHWFLEVEIFSDIHAFRTLQKIEINPINPRKKKKERGKVQIISGRSSETEQLGDTEKYIIF